MKRHPFDHPLPWAFAIMTVLVIQVFATDARADWNDVGRWMIELESRPVHGDGREDPRLGAAVCRIVGGDSERDELYYFAGHQEAMPHLNPDAVVGTDWRNEPFNISIHLHDEQWTSVYPFNRLVESRPLKKGDEIPAPVVSDSLFLFFPVWPIRDYPHPVNETLKTSVIAEKAITTGNYILADERQTVFGEPCRLYKSPSGIDWIWLSRDKPLCVVRRQNRHPKVGRVLWELAGHDIREVGPDRWLPTRIEYTSFLNPDKPDEPTRRVVTNVVDCRFGTDIPDDFFELKLAAGTIERTAGDQGMQFRQISDGGRFEHFDNLTKFYREAIGLPFSRFESAVWSPGVRILLAIICGGLIGGFLRKFGTPSRSGSVNKGS